jgi:hypothetical protein
MEKPVTGTLLSLFTGGVVTGTNDIKVVNPPQHVSSDVLLAKGVSTFTPSLDEWFRTKLKS